MTNKNSILTIMVVYALVLSACTPAMAITYTQTPEPTATITSSPTPRPEKNVALGKPVRVSASWIADPQ